MPSPSQGDEPAAARERLWFAFLRILPHHALSRLVRAITRCRAPWLAHALIRSFCRRYRVNLAEAAVGDIRAYACFNDFFTRALRPDARLWPVEPETVGCPVDGAVSQIGVLDGGRVIQAKNRGYALIDLLAGDGDRARDYAGGAFATLYLSPRDYHRIHMPVDGLLEGMVYVPGRLFPVNVPATRHVPNLFARNERLICHFATALGPMAVILVGALLVGGLQTVWAGEVAPSRGRRVASWDYRGRNIRLKRGDELGRFNMGSTVILLFGRDRVRWLDSLLAGDQVVLGEPLTWAPPPAAAMAGTQGGR